MYKPIPITREDQRNLSTLSVINIIQSTTLEENLMSPSIFSVESMTKLLLQEQAIKHITDNNFMEWYTS